MELQVSPISFTADFLDQLVVVSDYSGTLDLSYPSSGVDDASSIGSNPLSKIGGSLKMVSDGTNAFLIRVQLISIIVQASDTLKSTAGNATAAIASQVKSAPWNKNAYPVLPW